MTMPARLIITLCPLTILTGCAGVHLNDRNTLGGSTRLPFFEDRAPAEPRADLASHAGVDRASWTPTTILVPVDGTVHTPTYASARRPTKLDQPRRIGLEPTAESSLDLGSEPAVRAFETAREPFVALADLALLPVRMAFRPPWTTTQSPGLVMKRSPTSDVTISGSVHDAPNSPTEHAHD